MGHARWLYNNSITSTNMLTASSVRSGRFSNANPIKEGTAMMTVSGAYTGPIDTIYIIQIDSVAGGTQIGQSTFRWSDDDGVTFTNGILTSASPVALSFGAAVKFTTGGGIDFVVSDKWTFYGVNTNSVGKMLDLIRDTKWRSAGLDNPNTITVDFGSPKTIAAISAIDHNLTSAAVIKVLMNETNSWGSPSFSEDITWNDKKKFLHYLSSEQIYRFLQLSMSDQTNPDGSIEISELFAGPYFEPTQNFAYGYLEGFDEFSDEDQTNSGVKNTRLYNQALIFSLSYKTIPNADIEGFKTMQAHVKNPDKNKKFPVCFHEDVDEGDEFWLADLGEFEYTHDPSDRGSFTLDIVEVMKSKAEF